MLFSPHVFEGVIITRTHLHNRWVYNIKSCRLLLGIANWTNISITIALTIQQLVDSMLISSQLIYIVSLVILFYFDLFNLSYAIQMYII